MLTKQARLRASEVSEVIASGKTIRAKYLSAKVLRRRSGTMRSAVSVSKSVCKTAVKRNSIRRQIYRILAAIPHSPSAHIVFFVRVIPDSSDAFRIDVESVLQGALNL